MEPTGVSHLCSTMVLRGHDGPAELAADRGHVTRALEVARDPSPSQQLWLLSSAGSMRAASNGVLREVRDDLDVPSAERARGVPEAS